MDVLNAGVEYTWLGHGTFLIRSANGKRILLDPWVDGNPACPEEYKGENGITELDLIVCTHAHFDHIGDAIPIARRTQAAVIGIFELCAWLNSKGVENCTGINKGGRLTVEGITLTMTHADHSCGITDGDQIIYGGEAAGYVIEFENAYKVYHAGDTNVFGDMALIAELYQPDLCVLPIGDFYTMGPDEAAKAIRLLGTKKVVPCHYGTFPILDGSPARLREFTSDISGLTIYDLEPGQTLR
ncbi:MAG: metal-dependent hydrolase [Ardenticatenaceae bacterium]|nr:metal-dependent hydrolase [Ardenticatenaceae bacterium]